MLRPSYLIISLRLARPVRFQVLQRDFFKVRAAGLPENHRRYPVSADRLLKPSHLPQCAHRLAERFPDGQFFLPLHAHTPGQRPVYPADALASLLLTAGLAPQQIPPGVEARRHAQESLNEYSGTCMDMRTDNRAHFGNECVLQP